MEGGLKIKKFFIYLISLILLLIIQLSIPPELPLFAVKPDLLLIIITVLGLLLGTKYGAGFGFIAGTFQDLFLGGILGVFTILKTFTGGLAGLMEGNVFKERYFIAPLIIFVNTVIHDIVYIFLSENLIFNISFLQVLKQRILPEAFLNALLGLIIYYIFYKIEDPGGSYYE
ncbi:MAG: rod shape-determining protein MreD [Halothermotrichaceae bacterium]